MILLHEVAHIQRADWLFQLLAQLTRSLYWFHPGVWWAVRRLQAESELACDDMVILAGVAPTDYAATLVEIVRTMNRSKTSSHLPSSALSMARPPLEARLRAMLAPHPRRRPSRAMVLLASLGTVLPVMPLAVLHVGATPVEKTPRVLPIPRPMQADASLALSPLLGHGTTSRRLSARQQTTQNGQSLRRSASKQDENRQLRQRLDTLEQLLVRNQQENATLRQQLMALQKQKHQAASNAKQAANNAKAVEAMQTANRRAQITALEATLQDFKQHQAALSTQYSRTQQLYQSGSISQNEVNKTRAALESNQVRINALSRQLDELHKGRRISMKEQTRRQLVVELDQLQIMLRTKKENAAVVKARYDAGIVGQSELAQADQEAISIQIRIDENKAKARAGDDTVKHRLLRYPVKNFVQPRRFSRTFRTHWQASADKKGLAWKQYLNTWRGK